MPNATFEDVTDAVLAAMKNFENDVQGNIPQYFDGGDTTVLFNIKRRGGPANGDRWDFGHPTMYTYDPGQIGKLNEWWAEVKPNGALLPAAFKPSVGCWEINLVFDTGNRRFNYHVALS